MKDLYNTSYITFYKFIKKYLNPNFLLDLDIEKDRENEVLLNFKNHDLIFIKNFNDEEMIKYLYQINLFNFSFYKNADYTLDRLYKKLNNNNKLIFKNIIDNLSNENSYKFLKNTSNIYKNLACEIIKKDKYNEKINNIFNKLNMDIFQDPIKIAHLIDDICLDEELLNIILSKVKIFINDIFNINQLNDATNSNIKFIDILDTIMIINPNIDIYIYKAQYSILNTYITEIIDNSKTLINLSKELSINYKNSDKQPFKQHYNIKYITDHKILLKLSDNFLNNFDNIDIWIKKIITSEFIYKYTFTEFKIHLCNFILYLYSLCISFYEFNKNKKLLTNLINTIKEELNHDYSNKDEEILITNYIKIFMNIINNKDFNKINDLITIIINDKELFIEFINKNYLLFNNCIINYLSKNGLNRAYDIFNNLINLINIDFKKEIINIINKLENEEYRNKIISKLIFILNIFNKLEFIKKFNKK